MTEPKQAHTVLLSITGTDYPGILADIMKLIRDWEIEIQDVQQTTSLGQLSLNLLLCVPSAVGLESIRDIIKITRQQKVNCDFYVLAEGELVRDEDSEIYVLTMLSSSKINAASYHALANACGEMSINIVRMNRLSRHSLQCIEFNLALTPEQVGRYSEIKRELFKVAFEHEFDLAIQPENLYRRSKRLIVMDMDSTLIQQEVIDEIADFAGVKAKVAAITERAMKGELDFRAALDERVALLKGISTDSLDKVIERIELTPGAENLVRILKKLGFKLAVISGGFRYFTEHFQQRLGLDYSFANTLEFKNGELTGKLNGEVVDRARKAELLRELAATEGIPVDQTIAVGDGANDLDMLEAAGLGIAFNAKPTVKEQAKGFISQPRLDSILYLLGVSGKEIAAMAADD